MIKNYMADVANILGVEIDEKFKVEKYSDCTFRITMNGLEQCYETDCNVRWNTSLIIGKLLNGELGIIKSPWKPKKKEWYYYPNAFYSDVEIKIWGDMPFDYAMQALGMCYRTKKEAEERFAEDYKKLTGKELEKE